MRDGYSETKEEHSLPQPGVFNPHRSPSADRSSSRSCSTLYSLNWAHCHQDRRGHGSTCHRGCRHLSPIGVTDLSPLDRTDVTRAVYAFSLLSPSLSLLSLHCRHAKSTHHLPRSGRTLCSTASRCGAAIALLSTGDQRQAPSTDPRG